MNDYINDAFTREGNNTNLVVNNLNVGCITSIDNNFEIDSNGNLTVKTITAERISGNAISNTLYPVGSIYMSINNTNPTTLFGGEWEQIKDCFLLAAGIKHSNGEVGGEETHKLTINEMPSHSHQARFGSVLGGDGTGYRYSNTDGVNSVINQNTGGNQEHNNMPPYLTVYMWKRIS